MAIAEAPGRNICLIDTHPQFVVSSEDKTPETSFDGSISIYRLDAEGNPANNFGAVGRGETFEEALANARNLVGAIVTASLRIKEPNYLLNESNFQLRFSGDGPTPPKTATYPNPDGPGTIQHNYHDGSKTLIPVLS